MSSLILEPHVRGNLTEWCLFKPQLELGEFVKSKIRTLYDRIISDTLVNCSHIEGKVKDSLYSNTTSVVEEIGLKSIILDTMMRTTSYSVKVEVINGAIIYTKLTNSMIKEDAENNILVIDNKQAPTYELYDYYTMIYEYMIFANSVLKLANKPLIKFNDYRSQEGNLANADAIVNQVRESLQSLKRIGGFAILDAKDQVEMFAVDLTKYEGILTQAYNGIADTLGLPISYFTGEVSGSWQSLGEGDRIKCLDVFLRYYTNMLHNVLKRVYNIVGYEYKVVFNEYLEYKLKAILPVLQALERTTLLTDEQKQTYIKKIITTE